VKLSIAMKHFSALVRKAKFPFKHDTNCVGLNFTSRLKCDLKSWRKLLNLRSIRYWQSIWVCRTSTYGNVTKQIW